MAPYVAWLLGLSIPFVIWERLQPRNPQQPIVRPLFWTDLGYIALNGHLIGLLVGRLTMQWSQLPSVARVIDGLHVRLLASQPTWIQAAALIVTLDFIQWCIHNALHRVPWLWEIHKVHHSIEQLDWMGNWRFHWIEGVLYKSLLFVPMALLGANLQAMGLYAILGTFMGHFNHANLRVSIGPLRYLLNSPAMHIWHHTHPDSGPVDHNFGIIFSLWDWLFGTAFMPPTNPRRLGFAGMERFPRALWRQLLVPLTVPS